MNQTATAFLSGLTARVNAMEEHIHSVKRNWVLMACVLECGRDHELRSLVNDLVHQDRLADSNAETIVYELPRLVEEAREMIRYRREEALAADHARLLREEEERHQALIAKLDVTSKLNDQLSAAIASLIPKDSTK